MTKHQCIYKYTKGAQSTETDETDNDSDTERQHGQSNMFFVSFLFFFLWLGLYVWASKPQRHDQLAKPPCSAPHENYPAVGKYKLKIQASTVDFLAGLGLYVGTSHPKIRHAVKSSIQKEFEKCKTSNRKILYTLIQCLSQKFQRRKTKETSKVYVQVSKHKSKGWRKLELVWID